MRLKLRIELGEARCFDARVRMVDRDDVSVVGVREDVDRLDGIDEDDDDGDVGVGADEIGHS